MTNEETIIQENLGKQNPYRVPEGYFDSFYEKLMAELPEHTKPEIVAMPQRSRLRFLRPALLAAACLCVAIFSITLFFSHQQETPEQTPVAAATSTTNTVDEEEYMDEAADYVMLDNADIYACLSE